MRCKDKNRDSYWMRAFGLLLAGLILAVSNTKPIAEWVQLPQQIRLFEGTSTAWSLDLPVTVTVATSNSKVAAVHGIPHQSLVAWNLSKPLRIDSVSQGDAELQLRLFGKLPLKSIHVSVLPHLEVIPGGQSIGVKIKSNGIMVVGYNLVKNGEQSTSPGEQASIKIGDVIDQINHITIKSVEQASQIIDQTGRKHQVLTMRVLRNQQPITIQVHPRLDKDTGTYRIGLYIRDSAAGVGTLTFYDPTHKTFGSLGHVITDMDTGRPISVGEGQVVHATVTSIDKGESGQPGEKRGIMVDEKKILGSINKNTDFGVFGKMTSAPDHGLIRKPVPVALAEQVHEGPATILTVVKGQKVEEFQVQIVNVMHQKFPATKSMIIKVTDPRLLSKTGGIIQGMSGSPILQDGKLVGAVTHVFINDPTQGYGVFVEWMLRDSGVNLRTLQSAM